MQFQLAKGISPADGNVGPMTRAAINALISNQNPVGAPQKGDLALTAFSFTPFNPTVSDTDPYIYYDFTIQNVGNATLNIPKETAFTLYKENINPNNIAGKTMVGVGFSLAPGESKVFSRNTTSQSPNIRAVAGKFPITLVADSGNLVSETRRDNNSIQLSMEVVSGLTISTPSSLPNAQVGTPYEQSLMVTGGDPLLAHEWRLSSGTLPPRLNLSLDAANMAIMGTPTIAGTYTFTLTVTYYSAVTPLPATKQFTLVVAPAPEIKVSCTPSANSAEPVATVNYVGSLTISSPNGGECLTQGTTKTITWKSTPNIDKVTITLMDSEKTGSRIADNIPNTGSYSWNVSKWNTINTKFKIDILGYQTGFGSVNDYSDDYFTIN